MVVGEVVEEGVVDVLGSIEEVIGQAGLVQGSVSVAAALPFSVKVWR